MKYIGSFLSGIMLFAAAAFNAGAQNDATFLNYADNARSISMGGASMAMSANGSSIMTNPAAMALSDATASVELGYLGLNPGNMTNVFNLSAFYNISDRFSVSVYGKGAMMPEYALVDNGGNLLGNYAPYDYMVGAGFAAEIIDGLAVGLNAKYVASSKVSGDYIALNPEYRNAGAFAADISLMYSWSDFRVAAGVTNLGTSLKYSTLEGAAGSLLPSAARVGFGYGHDWDGHSLDANVQADYFFNAPGTDFSAGIGAEYGFRDMLFVRGGFHYAYTSGTVLSNYASVGIGGKFFDMLKIDAAYLIPVGAAYINSLGNTFMVSLGFEF